jgi:hypothetical protein
MTDQAYLDDRLNRVIEPLFLATLENLPAMLDDATRVAAKSDISALWATFNDTDRAEIRRFVDYWSHDARTNHVFATVCGQMDVAAAMKVLTSDDRNRVIAHTLWIGHPPAAWSGRVDPT